MITKDKNILSIETSGRNCSIALSSDSEIIYYNNIEDGNQHDRMLAELIRQAMKEFNSDYSKLNAVAVSSGPGSFTGLRIGIAIAKGLAFDNAISIIPVPSLDAIVYYFLDDIKKLKKEKISSVIHSHKDYYYYKFFQGSFKEIGELKLTKADELKSVYTDDVLFVGPGIENLGGDFFREEYSFINARMISSLAQKLFKEEKFIAAKEIIPYYAQEFKPK